MASWKDAEASVRHAASSIWSTPFRSMIVHGRQIDAYGTLDDKRCVAIEVTEKKDINKIQEDLNKLIHVRNVNFQTGFIHTECVCVTTYEPTAPMRTVGKSQNIDVISIDEFKHKFLPFDEYHIARNEVPFGSAIDPKTGHKDRTEYVLASFKTQNGGEINTTDITQIVSSGKHVIIIGEYGTGKSKCIERVYNILSETAWDKLNFPLAVDLRKCWGLKDRYEIIRRHLRDLNLERHTDSFTRAYNSGMLECTPFDRTPGGAS